MDPNKKLTSKISGWYEKLPYEVRSLTISKMGIDTVSKFMHISRQYFEECSANSSLFKGCFDMVIEESESKYRLKMMGVPGNSIQSTYYDWSLEFRRTESMGCTEITLMSKGRLSFRFLSVNDCWSEKGELADVFTQHLENYLNGFGKNLRTLEIDLDSVMTIKMSRLRLGNSNQLEKLIVHPNAHNVCLISSGFIDFEQLKKISAYIKLPATNINFDQLIQLKARKIYIHKMDWTTEDVEKLCESWKKGELHPNIREITIYGKFETPPKKQARYFNNELRSDCEHLKGKVATYLFDQFYFEMRISDLEI